jgi:hypothetical protein
MSTEKSVLAECGHQGEDDCYGQCAISKIIDALYGALCQADHSAVCPAGANLHKPCECWRRDAYAALKAATV